eukprot:4789100-Prymnesium_polylepis.1
MYLRKEEKRVTKTISFRDAEEGCHNPASRPVASRPPPPAAAAQAWGQEMSFVSGSNPRDLQLLPLFES